MHTGIHCWRVWWKASKTTDVRQCSFTIFSFSNSSEMLSTLLAVLPLKSKLKESHYVWFTSQGGGGGTGDLK